MIVWLERDVLAKLMCLLCLPAPVHHAKKPTVAPDFPAQIEGLGKETG
jgi:hypothetical protein